MNYKARLAEILEKIKTGELSLQDKEDFESIQRIIKTKDYASYCVAVRPTFTWGWFHKVIQDSINKAFTKKKGRLICKMGQQHGKEVANTTLIKIPNGYKKIGDVKIGDVVDSGCGRYTEVTGVFPQGIKNLYKVVFEDGREVECGLEHLWEIHSTRWKGQQTRIVNTEEIIRLNKLPAYKDNLYIPRYIPIDEPNKDLWIDPYLLGTLLGDGSFSKTVKLTSSDQHIVNRCNIGLNKLGCELRYNDRYDYTIKNTLRELIDSRGRSTTRTYLNPLKEKIREMGLLGKNSFNKFIPREYLESSYQQRLELIQGLMDTDGSIGKQGTIEYCTSSIKLATHMQELIRSIGGLAAVTTRMGSYTKHNVEVQTSINYRISIRMADQTLLFSLPRKLERCQKKHRRSEANKYLRIKYIEYARKEEATCIAVADESHLYTIKDYIVTHNSELFGRCAASYVFGKFPEWKILYLTYSDARAKEVSADILGLIISDEYNDIFPNVQLKDDLRENVRVATKRRQKLTISNFTNMNSKRGEFKATGIEGSYNGYDANLIILDDYFSGYDEANSPTIRDSRWNAFVNNILVRQQKETVILVMGTQWHTEDIIGRLEDYIKVKPENAPSWEVLEFNAIKDERDYPYDHRKTGEYLWPEQRMDVYLEKQALDPIGFMTTYQNTPPSMSGVVFDASCFRWYDTIMSPTSMSSARIIISVDPNYKKDSKQGDEAAIVVLAIAHNNAYLLEFSSVNKVDITDNINRIKDFMRKYPNYYAVLVEAKGQGEDIVTLMHQEGLSRIQAFDPGQASKLFRAQEMIPYCRSGQFWLPSPNLRDVGNNLVCPDIQKYCNEFLKFTGFQGGKDNLVDATTQVFIAYKYLLEPLLLQATNYSIKNQYQVGKGLTNLTNPLQRLQNGTKKLAFTGRR